MNQTENSEFRTKESPFKQFRRTCLGKIVIALGIFIILLIIAWITNPSEKKMIDEMDDNIKQSIWSRDSIEADDLDIFVSNIGHTFTHWSDSVTEDMKSRLRRFNQNLWVPPLEELQAKAEAEEKARAEAEGEVTEGEEGAAEDGVEAAEPAEEKEKTVTRTTKRGSKSSTSKKSSKAKAKAKEKEKKAKIKERKPKTSTQTVNAGVRSVRNRKN
jgi:hypothetical protein